MKKILLIVLCLLFITACQIDSSGTIPSQKTIQNKTISCDRLYEAVEYSVNIPSNWEINDWCIMEMDGQTYQICPKGESVMFIGPKEEGYPVRISVQIYENEFYNSLQDYVDYQKESESMIFSTMDYELIKEGNITISNTSAYYLTSYKFFTGFPIKSKEVIFLRGSNEYSIAISSHESTFDSNKIFFDEFINSFEFIH